MVEILAFGILALGAWAIAPLESTIKDIEPSKSNEKDLDIIQGGLGLGRLGRQLISKLLLTNISEDFRSCQEPRNDD